MNKQLITVACLALALAIAGCGIRRPGMQVVYVPEADGKGVTIHRRVDSGGTPKNMGYSHPHQFTGDELEKEMALLVVSEYEYGGLTQKGKWNTRLVFPPDVARNTAPALAAAFRDAGPSDTVGFDIPGPKGLAVSGEVYLDGSSLVWLIKSIEGVSYLGKDPFLLDGRDWTIEQKPYFMVRKDKDKRLIKVVRDLSMAPEVEKTVAVPVPAAAPAQPPSPAHGAAPAPMAAPVPAPGHAAPAVPASAPSFEGMEGLEKKLKKLKEWNQKGLISDQDYARQKDAILKKLQQM